MPRFFIDTDDGRMAVADGEGHDLADAPAARALALRALCDMLGDEPTAGDRRAFTARVRAEGGATLYTAALTLTGAWGPAPPGA